MDKKKSFIVFAPEFLALSNHLTLKQRGELMTALCEMVLYGEPMKTVSEAVRKAYDFMAESVSENFNKYDAVCEKRKAIALKAASKRRANAEQKSANCPAKAEHNDNEDKNVNDMKNKNDRSLKEKIRQKENVPTLNDVKVYCAVRGFKNVKPEEFFDYYNARNWSVGGVPISDWQAKLIKWAGENDSDANFTSIGNCVRLPMPARQGGAND